MYGCNKPFWPLPYAKAYSLELDWILEELRKVQEGGGIPLDSLIKSIDDIKSELASIVASPGIVYDTQKLGGVAADQYALKTDTAPNSLKLGGVVADQYALKTDTAPDSLKLGGKPGSEYASAESLRQLNADKLDKTDVANNLTTIDEGWALDARQGKWLNENKVGFGDITNDLVTSDVNKVLSAAQGVALKKLTSDGDKALEERLNATNEAVAGKISMKTATVNLPVSGWIENNQTVSVGGVTASNTVIVTASPASYVHYNECAVRCIAQGDGTLTFACTDTPTAELTANVLILS